MQIKVAGYNVDADLLQQLKTFLQEIAELSGLESVSLSADLNNFLAEDNLTPETISAAYARISRHPESISELRRMSRQSVARARKSNQNIVFEMGHSSIAEHAVFNVDISGISRLAVETIEARRLISFTEKSQRYIALNKEYIIPPELNNSTLQDDVKQLCDFLFARYQEILHRLQLYFQDKNDEVAKYVAREDARYLLPLTCVAQLGMTANARNIEHLLRRSINHPLMELRQFAIDLKTQVEKIAPSLIKHLDLSELETEYYPASFSGRVSEKDVALLHWSEDADNLALTNLYFSSEGVSWMEAQEKIKAMTFSQKKDFLKQQLHNLNCHQSLPRAFEVAEFGFQITLSSSAYAQLKRHRITTQIPRPYCKELGYTIPPSIEQLGLSEDFRRVIERTQDLYTRIYAINPLCASYVLTNAHRRVVYLKTNLRELYHISRLRMDASAQWDIRVIVSKMIELAQEKAPLTLALAGGKDEFEQIKKKFMED